MQLPDSAQAYITKLEELPGTHISLIGVWLWARTNNHVFPLFGSSRTLRSRSRVLFSVESSVKSCRRNRVSEIVSQNPRREWGGLVALCGDSGLRCL